jgi:hypothetical protein
VPGLGGTQTTRRLFQKLSQPKRITRVASPDRWLECGYDVVGRVTSARDKLSNETLYAFYQESPFREK